MRFIISVIFVVGCISCTNLNNDGYRLDAAPWADQKFEICSSPNTNGLRAVVFEPVIEEWTYTSTGPLETRIVFSDTGIREVAVKNERSQPAYFLREQRIGYVDDKNYWVDQSGTQISNFEQIKRISGEKIQPEIKSDYERFVYKANFELENAAAMKKIVNEPPCTIFSVGHNDKLESKLQYNFGPNNPYECDAEQGLKRSEKLNYSDISHRPVICCPDGSNYYVKFRDGQIKTYRAYHDMQTVLYPDDNSQRCEWNDLGSLIGYELIQANE